MVTTTTPTAFGERVERMRDMLRSGEFGSQVNREMLPPDIARTSREPLMDFSDWEQFTQWTE